MQLVKICQFAGLEMDIDMISVISLRLLNIPFFIDFLIDS